jgi:hypothetical protein
MKEIKIQVKPELLEAARLYIEKLGEMLSVQDTVTLISCHDAQGVYGDSFDIEETLNLVTSPRFNALTVEIKQQVVASMVVWAEDKSPGSKVVPAKGH